MKVVRFGVSVENSVLDILDNYIKTNRFPNRSQAIRHLIQNLEVKSQWDKNQIVGGSLTLIYDHHKRTLVDKLTQIQHAYHHEILCAQHIHLDHDNCMEIIAMKGKAAKLKELADKLISVKGVIHGDFSMTKLS
jgi:CopG family nickel-responsive transcriptional regulator